jgi:hypothetical protein
MDSSCTATEYAVATADNGRSELVDRCEHGNEPSDSKKGGEFSDY